MTFSERAKSFVSSWRAPTQPTCDEATLVYMVALEIERAAIRAEQQVRDERPRRFVPGKIDEPTYTDQRPLARSEHLHLRRVADKRDRLPRAPSCLPHPP